jgi:nucleotide-binding universal stress UspA family protein
MSVDPLEIKKLLFPVDFSDRCRSVSSYVTAFAQRFRSEVTLLHTVSLSDLPIMGSEISALDVLPTLRESVQSAQARMDSYLASEFPSTQVKRIVRQGDPSSEIVEFAHKENIDVIMIPSRGMGVFRRYLLGSVTSKVLHDARVPVWTSVHREQVPSPATETIRRVLCAVDLGDHSEKTLKWAAACAAAFGAELLAVHAVPGAEGRPAKFFDAEFVSDLVKRAREELEALVSRCGCTARVIVEAGAPSTVVQSLGEREGADLVVIARGAVAAGSGRLRTHAYAIIRDAPCPVVSV